MTEEENNRILLENYQIFLANEERKRVERITPNIERMLEDLEEKNWFIFICDTYTDYCNLKLKIKDGKATFATNGTSLKECLTEAWSKLK